MWQEKRKLAINSLRDFLNTKLETLVGRHLASSAEQHVLSLFQEVAATVPAYGAFLKAQGVDAGNIQTFEAFQKLPFITKDNYVNCHPIAHLCRNGRLETCDMVAVSSGSTGKPVFWPRFISHEFATAARFEQVFHDSFQADSRGTLAVVGFSLGSWVGGMYTAACCRHLASKGYPVTVITPGNDKNEILRVIKALGPAFDQVVFLGYPPFIKDVIDEGIALGMNWSRYRTKLVFAGEVFSEEWRSLICERVGSDNPYFDSAAFYGTADAGVLGNETPLSICIRRFLADEPTAMRKLFGESRLPTLVQYDPLCWFFETFDGTLLFTGDNGIPLVRYHISDEGGLITYDALLQFLAQFNFDPIKELRRYSQRGARSQPFVYVFGRSHFTISYFGAKIYPENITVGLQQAGIKEWVTGKFVMQVQDDEDQNKFLFIAVELAPNAVADDEHRKLVVESVTYHIRRLNSEFAHYVPEKYQKPRITLLPHGDPEWFPSGVKHRYTRP
ncbi:MAG: phenylacetate--CoA ligase family protein [Gammaproteobacteria bacterium]|nr:phenylacetate--CoA ligase family protein [Gammaproteobacteria bacterium]